LPAEGAPGWPAEAPVIPISLPVTRVVTDYVDFTGRQRGQFGGRAGAGERISGEDAVQGGAEVKQGQMLFQVDPDLSGPIGSAKGKSTCTRPNSGWPKRTTLATRRWPRRRGR